MFRLLTPLLALTLLSACGFQPVYAKKDADSSYKADSRAALKGVKVIQTENNRNGQILQIALEDALYPGNDKAGVTRYILNATPAVQEWPAVIETNQFVGRFNIRIMVQAELRDATTNQAIWHGNVMRLSSYNAAQQDFATFAARDDAMKRGLQSIAEDLTMQLQAKLSEDNPSASVSKKKQKTGLDLLPNSQQMNIDSGRSTMAPPSIY